MKGAVTPHTEPLLELFFRALSDDEPEVQCNAAYAIGLLIEYTQVDLSQHYLNVLASLRPLFVVRPDAPAPRFNARDNAVGAVGRMIVRNAAAVRLDQVLPVFIDALPLKNDYLENRPVFTAILHLFKTNPAALHPYMDRLLAVFAFVLDPSGPEQVDEDIRRELINLVGALHREDPSKVQAAGLGPFVPGA